MQNLNYWKAVHAVLLGAHSGGFWINFDHLRTFDMSQNPNTQSSTAAATTEPISLDSRAHLSQSTTTEGAWFRINNIHNRFNSINSKHTKPKVASLTSEVVGNRLFPTACHTCQHEHQGMGCELVFRSWIRWLDCWTSWNVQPRKRHAKVNPDWLQTIKKLNASCIACFLGTRSKTRTQV